MVFALLQQNPIKALTGNRFLDLGNWGSEIVKQVIPPEYRPLLSLAYDASKTSNMVSFRVPITNFVDYESLMDGVYRFDVNLTCWGAEPQVVEWITRTFGPQATVHTGVYTDNVVAVQTFGDFTRPENVVLNIREESIPPSSVPTPPALRFISTIGVVATFYLTLAKSQVFDSTYRYAIPESGFIFTFPVRVVSDVLIAESFLDYQNVKFSFDCTMVPNFYTVPPKYLASERLSDDPPEV